MASRTDLNINYIFGILTSNANDWYISESILRGWLVGVIWEGSEIMGAVSRSECPQVGRRGVFRQINLPAIQFKLAVHELHYT